jgi:hypothetical protein
MLSVKRLIISPRINSMQTSLSVEKVKIEIVRLAIVREGPGDAAFLRDSLTRGRRQRIVRHGGVFQGENITPAETPDHRG